MASVRVSRGKMYTIRIHRHETGRQGRRFVVTGVRVTALSVKEPDRAAALIEGYIEDRQSPGGFTRTIQSVIPQAIDLDTEADPPPGFVIP